MRCPSPPALFGADRGVLPACFRPDVCNVESLQTQIAGELLIANTQTLASAIYL